MIVRTKIPAIGESMGVVVQCSRRSSLDQLTSKMGEGGYLRIRFTLPWERSEEVRRCGLNAYPDFSDAKEGLKRLVASYCEAEDRDCETISGTMEELEIFQAKGYETRNSKRVLFDRRSESIVQELKSIRADLDKKK